MGAVVVHAMHAVLQKTYEYHDRNVSLVSLTVDVLADHRVHKTRFDQPHQRHVPQRRHGVVPTFFVVRQRFPLPLQSPHSVLSSEVRYACHEGEERGAAYHTAVGRMKRSLAGCLAACSKPCPLTDGSIPWSICCFIRRCIAPGVRGSSNRWGKQSYRGQMQPLRSLVLSPRRSIAPSRVVRNLVFDS